MLKTIFYRQIGNNIIRYKFYLPEARRYFRDYLFTSRDTAFDIAIDPSQLDYARQFLEGDVTDGYVEYRMLIPLTARYLLQYNSCIFHSVAFLYQGKAWLFAAPSGTGKTTQFLNWQRLFPEEVQIICGDMPIIETSEDGTLNIWPTSWNGKENMGSHIHAPLGGIVYLKQGQDNVIKPMSSHDAILPLWNQFVVELEMEDQIHALSGLLDHILTDYPIWEFVNKGDDDSTRLLRQTIQSWINLKE